MVLHLQLLLREMPESLGNTRESCIVGAHPELQIRYSLVSLRHSCVSQEKEGIGMRLMLWASWKNSEETRACSDVISML